MKITCRYCATEYRVPTGVQISCIGNANPGIPSDFMVFNDTGSPTVPIYHRCQFGVSLYPIEDDE